MIRIRWMVLFGLCTLVLSACGLIPPPAPTATPTATATPQPTATITPTLTATPKPTWTPRPTKTPTVEPTLGFEEPQYVPEGGYSFRPPSGYQVDSDRGRVGILDPDGSIMIILMGGLADTQANSAENILDQYLTGIFDSGEGEYQKSSPQVIGADGTMYEISGTIFDSPIRGQAVIFIPGPNRYLFGLGMAKTLQDEHKWDDLGRGVFTALIETITFSNPEPGQPSSTASAACTISTDTTYGYTRENPIKVGGDAFGGPPRERAFLDNLAGPNGEPVSYERRGSEDFGDTILDDYRVVVAGKEVMLYIDEYAYTDPQAPVGFTCLGPFPLTAP